jgi:hypothetical protein
MRQQQSSRQLWWKRRLHGATLVQRRAWVAGLSLLCALPPRCHVGRRRGVGLEAAKKETEEADRAGAWSVLFASIQIRLTGVC